MKVVFILAVVLGLSLAAPKSHIRSPRDQAGLAGDLDDLLALVDDEAVQSVLDDHLESDGGLAVVIEYLQSREWRELFDDILRRPGARELIDYLEENDIDAEGFLEDIRDSIEDAEPGVEPDEEGSLRSFLDDIEAAIPLDDIAALINDKLQSSTATQDLYVFLSGDSNRQFIEEVRGIPEVQRLAERLRELDANVDDALAIFYDFLGWGTPEPPTEGPTPPTDDGSRPTDDGGPPTDDGGPPTDDGGPPTDDGGPPTDDGSRPTDDGSRPTPPTGDWSPPTDDGSRPTGDFSPPTDGPLVNDEDSPPTDDGPPPTDDGPPPTDDGSPPTDDGPPPTDDGSRPTDDGSPPTPPTGDWSPPTDDGSPPTGDFPPPTDEPSVNARKF